MPSTIWGEGSPAAAAAQTAAAAAVSPQSPD